MTQHTRSTKVAPYVTTPHGKVIHKTDYVSIYWEDGRVRRTYVVRQCGGAISNHRLLTEAHYPGHRLCKVCFDGT